ncbi:MAG: glycosyltransferase family 2 protein [Hyphomicrobiaceae bacterium]
MSQTPRPEVSILVVSYNPRARTLAAISSAAAETRSRHEIIVVDNASADGSAAAIAAHPAAPRLIALDDNIGFARANNVAARAATGDYLLLLNPDTVVLGGAIDQLLAFARARPSAGIWGGRTLFADGRLNPSSCWRRMTVWNLFCRATGLTGIFPGSRLFNSEAMAGWRRDTVREVDIVSGCFLLIRREMWQRLGGFDPTFFMYGEEADLCLRARAVGARPVVTPKATIVHLGGASEATRAGKMVRLLAAKTTLIDRHMPPMTRTIGRTLLRLWPLTRWLALAAATTLTANLRAGQAAATWREIWDRRGEWQRGLSTVEPAAMLHAPNGASRP